MAAPVTKYEFRTLRLETTKPDTTSMPTLNELGAQGWQVADVWRSGGAWRTFLLQREVPK